MFKGSTVFSHVCLSINKREQLSPSLHLRLLATAISLGICLFALFCGVLLLLLAAADRDGDGISVAQLSPRAMRMSGYSLLGGGSAVSLFLCVCWVALVRVAHCELRDQEHQLTRERYQFPAHASPGGVAMETVGANDIAIQPKSGYRAQQLAPVSEERLVL